MVRRISRTNSCKTSRVGWTPGKARREACVSHSGWRAFKCLFRREQPSACTAVSLHVGVGVILTAKAPNRRRSSERSVEVMTQGRARHTQGRDNGHDHFARHRPRGAAAWRRWILLQTQGLSRKGGSLAGIIRPVTKRTPRSHELSSALTRGGPSAPQGPRRANLRRVSRGAQRSGESC